ncbi:MAG: 2-C-methyl-D-erythritol 4-phosphate cytidylyltransferase [Muribaculaceae bacterium]|nr:2-C-methyl-D-erythritol 4-phosphate cytidylyltransferase [Muribaculaceae bacterium]
MRKRKEDYPKRYAIIVAGGSGSRMGGGMPKQFRSLCGRPVLWWSMKAFHDEDPTTQIILVLPEDFITLWEDFYSALPLEARIEYRVTSGGSSRTESVKKGLALVDTDNSLVAIHDGARPMVSPKMIYLGWDTAAWYGAGVPVVPVVDSLRRIEKDHVSHPVNREDFRIVQTPQVFYTPVIKEAYLKAGDKVFTDDATVAENNGQFISLFEGDPSNMKITNPKDLAIAEVLMSGKIEG